MTLWTVNKLMYLLKKRLPSNFYILQMTEKAWIPDYFYDKSLDSVNKKIEKSIERQFAETKGLTAQELHDISFERLETYVKTNKDELKSWLEL